ncbi:hypothetical protein [Thioalkalivibrio sp. ALE19]|uniref:hypothetical protein n=1 Tax=Thioalkalivibrio sp. ALE19 TaxID=1266909 RepID=UPI0003F9EE9B|nr:hypothetical protein [Thioalkalivibrio sp. ALE19]
MFEINPERLEILAQRLQTDPDIDLALADERFGLSTLVIVPTGTVDLSLSPMLRTKVLLHLDDDMELHRCIQPTPIFGDVLGERRKVGFSAPYWKYDIRARV